VETGITGFENSPAMYIEPETNEDQNVNDEKSQEELINLTAAADSNEP
jgi:hypothetical protein